MSQKKLRTGFTTGTSAAASARACMISIASQSKVDSVDVPLPRGGTIKIKIDSCEFSKTCARCTVIKDGGDDPDVTHGAQITVECEPNKKPGTVELLRGVGVGIVTKPGLGLELNAPAINPVPRKMITEGVMDTGADYISKNGLNVTISVKDGAEIAKKTDNIRLGILEGISILGTSGIVVPFSTAAFAASVRQNIDVAIAMKQDHLVLSTGGRSEEYAQRLEDNLPDHCYVQMGDFAGYAIRQCAKSGVKSAHIVGFIGKLAKMAAGVKQTHVKGSKVDIGFLADIAAECGADAATLSAIKGANTARHAGQIATEHGVSGFFEGILRRVHSQMSEHAEGRVRLQVTMFGFDGIPVARWPAE